MRPGERKYFYYRVLVWTTLALFAISCSEDKDPSPAAEEDNLVEAVVTGTRTADELKFLIQLSGRDIDPALFAYDVDVYNVVYTTTYREAEIEASGLVLLPKTDNSVPMISFQHGTIVQHSQAPSVQSKNSEQVVSYAALASMGFITAVPDFIGFGESKDIFHPYYVETATTTAVIDLIRAAATLAKEKELDFNTRLFLAGYSQGGYATLATHKELETNPHENLDLIASFPGAGGYDLAAMQEYFFSLETYPDPYYLAYVGMSYQEYYDQEGLVQNFFNEPYASQIPGLFDGSRSATDINAALTDEIDILVSEEALNAGSETSAFFQEKFAENTLVDWAPTRPVFLYHGDADTTVPHQNSILTYEKLIDNGASPETVKLFILPGGDHTTAVEPYIEDVVKKLQELK